MQKKYFNSTTTQSSSLKADREEERLESAVGESILGDFGLPGLLNVEFRKQTPPQSGCAIPIPDKGLDFVLGSPQSAGGIVRPWAPQGDRAPDWRCGQKTGQR